MREQILEAMRDCEPYTAGDLAEELDEPRRTVDYHLRQLEDNGEVNKKQHSKRRVSWWIDE